MTTPTIRVRYTISAPTLARLNAAMALGERRKVLEHCMQLALQDHQERLERITIAFMADSTSAVSLVAGATWGGMAGDGLAKVRRPTGRSGWRQLGLVLPLSPSGTGWRGRRV